MASLSDGVSKFWLMRSQGKSGLDIKGCSGVWDAAWFSAVWSAGYSPDAKQRLLDAIAELERAVVDLKNRVEEDYDDEHRD